MKTKLLITGANGALARQSLDFAEKDDFEITGFDRVLPSHPALSKAEVGEIHDERRIAEVIGGQDVVLHLAGIPLEDSWESLLHVNVDGTFRVLVAALAAGVRRVILASSIHATGFARVPGDGSTLSTGVEIAPDTLYGVSKAAGEALGKYFSARFGLEVVILRIASRQMEPTTRRTLQSWLSPRDAWRLIRAAATGDVSGHSTVWGSRLTRGRTLMTSPRGT